MFPHKTVAENVSFGLQRAVGLNEALDLVRLAHLERRLSSRTFSGGEQQRVALACALAPNPAVLLLDEPFSNMDVNLRTRIREEVKLSLLTRLLPSSSLPMIRRRLYSSGWVVIINDGKIEQSGTPEQVFHEPETKFAAGFLGNADFLSAEYLDGKAKTELGTFSIGSDVPRLCHVMTRPNDIELTRSVNGTATILQGRFKGYRTCTVSGCLFRCRRAGLQRLHHKSGYEPGELVIVTVVPHYVA